MLKSILNLEGVHSLSKNEQKNTNGGFGDVPIAGFCQNSLRACLNICTGPNTICGPCLDNNASSGQYECRYTG